LLAVTAGRVVHPDGAKAWVALVLSPVTNAMVNALTAAAAGAE
jgi:hypothetical protein